MGHLMTKGRGDKFSRMTHGRDVGRGTEGVDLEAAVVRVSQRGGKSSKAWVVHITYPGRPIVLNTYNIATGASR